MPTSGEKMKYEDLIQEGQSAGWEVKYFPIQGRIKRIHK